jgi:hypothetical protein
MTDPATIAALAALMAAGKPAIETACRSFEALTGKPLEVAGGMLGDFLYRRRVQHLLAFLEEVTPRIQALRGQGVDLQPLSQEFGLPLFDSVQSVENPDLRAMWIGLLESGLRRERTQRPLYVQVLRSLGPSEAQALREIAGCLSAGLDRTRLAELMPEVGLLQALGLIEVSNMPMFSDGSLTTLEHARQVRAVVRGRAGAPEPDTDVDDPTPHAPRAKVTLSLLGAEFVDAVEVRELGQGWNARAIHRTRELLLAIDAHVPGVAPGRTAAELATHAAAGSTLVTSPEEVTYLLHVYASAMGWKRTDDRWTRAQVNKA